MILFRAKLLNSEDSEESKTVKSKKRYEMYSWGTYDTYLSGKHSFGHEVPKRVHFDNDSESGKIFDHTSITHVEVTLEFTIALTEEGELYSWGWGDKGKLGLGDLDAREKPEKIRFVHYKKLEKESKEKESKEKKIKEFEQEYEKIRDSEKKIEKFGSKDELIQIYSAASSFKCLQGGQK